ncbi:MAG: four helix bundle protein [Verrucomicrobiota bacterium]
MNHSFRFQNLDIWKRSAAISIQLFALADNIEGLKHYRWAEQLRSAVLSITNNIAEGSGSSSKPEFGQFLNYSRRSIFETANMLIMLKNEFHLDTPLEDLLSELDEISRMITTFRKTLI